MNEMEILAIIPARGGSKGIHHKNLVHINGKPLLFYAISAAMKSKLITKIVVTTDDSKISSFASKMNIQVIQRSKNLSNDHAKLEPVITHTLQYLAKENFVPDLIVLLQNTSPLRTSKHIDEAICLLQTGYDSVLSGFNSHYFLWIQKKKFVCAINYDPMNRPNRQQMKKQFIENGAIYITKYSFFKKYKCRISGKIGIYEMPQSSSLQVDSKYDLFLIEQIMKKGTYYEK